MRNTLEVTMQRMSLFARDGILLYLSIIVAISIIFIPPVSHAAIGTTTQNWPATPIYTNAAYPSAAITYNAVAGNNRLLVVGISSSTTAVNQPQPTVTYGGTAMTYGIGADATATQQHSYLFYLPLGSSASADTGKTIAVTISGGTSRYCIVNAAVYTGVDQVTPVASPVRWSNGTTASNAVGPFTLAVNSGELGISVLNGVTSTKLNAPTIALGATGHIWSQVSTAASGKLIGALRTTFATTANANAATATQHTTSAQQGALTVNSSAAMTIKPIQGITVANGPTVAGNKLVYVNDGANSSNVVVDTFTMTADVLTTVTGITFTSNANTTSANVSAIKIWRKVGATLTAWEGSDFLAGSGSATGGAVSISVNESVSAVTQNYIVTYDIASGAAASTASILTGTITAITPTAIALTDTSAFSASVYIYPTTTLGNGTEPATARLSRSSAATNLDAFTLSHNSSITADDDTISNVTVTMTPQYISGGSGGTVSKIKLMEIVDSTGTILYGSVNLPTTGDTWNIPVSGLVATQSLTTYYVRISTADTITPSVTDTSGTLEGYYVFNGTITAYSHTKVNNKPVNSDSTSQALEIDVEKPIGPASANAVTGSNNGEINLTWADSNDPNGGSPDPLKPYVIMRSAPDGGVPNPGCIDGTDISTVPGVTIDYGVPRSATDVGLIDVQATQYQYRICSKDSLGNLSTGATALATARVNSVCTNPPSINLIPDSQIVKSTGTPFTLQIANTDTGSCPDVIFSLALANEAGSIAHFDKSFPATVTLGTGGAGAPTGTTVPITITGRPEAGQLEQYKFAITVTSPGNNHGGPQTTPQVTGVLNDMPPIVHNSGNMAKYQYGSWGETYTCATCHSNSTTNIKGVYTIISTPIGRRNVVFTKTSSSVTDSDGVYSNDQRSVKNVSNNVCSVCHHRTRQHQYSANKVGNVVGPDGDEEYTSDHHNSHDCVRCHTHNTAFRSIYGLCGDCHGFKNTGYSPINKSTMVKDLTNALGPAPPNYGAHLRHNIAQMTCAACHSNTNHGLDLLTWIGDNKLEIGFTVSKDTVFGFNSSATITGGTFYGTNNLNVPFTWQAGPGTTINQIADYNNSCNTYCHGTWSGNTGSQTQPIWVGGPTQVQCGSCHYATGAVPPTSGSHAKHSANTGAGLGIACSKCHSSYANYTGRAHINGKVEWSMTDFPGSAYKGSIASSTNAPAPTAAINYGTCSALYCHSNIQDPLTGLGGPTTYASPAPVWGGTAPCGSCHVYPNTTGSHASHENVDVAFDCHVCHNTGGTTSPLNHSDGKIDFKFVGLGQKTRYMGISSGSVTPGTAYGTCSTSNCHGSYTRAWGTTDSGLPMCDKCHGSATSPRGFYNTRGPDGTLSIYSAAIGVHDIHIQNPNSPRKTVFNRFTSYAKGFSCRQCHSVPSGPFTAGHIDTALPAEVPFSHMSSIANTGVTKFSYYSSPKYTGASQTCSSVWCHGAGMNSNNSTGPYAGVPGSIQRQNLQWSTPILSGNGTVDCVKCHAMPPPAPDSGYIHFGKTLVNCIECHVHLTNDGLGFKNKSLHINGTIDGGCDRCHGYPPINNIIGDHEGLATPAQGALRLGTAGAHNAHALNANIGNNCQTCHFNFTALMPSNNLEIGFNGYNGAVTSGTFTGYSNSDVHPRWTATNAGTTILKGATGANVCSNLYCHGGGTATLPVLGGGSKTNPNWEGGSGDAICGTCHGADTTNIPSGSSHTRHASAANGGVGLLCNSCHGSSVNMTHVNGAVSWSMDRTNPVIGANATYNSISSGKIVGLAPRNNGSDYRTCNTVYCHSNVQGANGIGQPTQWGTPTWGSINPSGCGFCHQDMKTAAQGVATGSHYKHANAAGMNLTCGYCHQDGGSGSLNHTDTIIYVNFTSYVGGAYSNNGRTAGSAAGYGSCATTFCHGTATSDTWGTTGPLACNRCHSARVQDVSWSGRHKTHYNYSTMPATYNETLNDLSSNNKYRFNCQHCHDVDSTKHSIKPASADSAARVFFGISAAGTSGSRRGLYSYGSPQGATDNGFKFTNGTCNTSYCHSDGKRGLPLNTALNWITTPTTGSNCLYCHDGKTTGATASKLSPRHDKHMNPTNNAMIGTGNGFNCADCHARTVFKNLSVGNKARHLNAMVDYSGAKANKNYNGATQVCSNVYCHSNGNPGYLVYVNMTGSKTWSGAGTITTCNKCHGRSNTLGFPDYANGGASHVRSNLHFGHMSSMSTNTNTTGCADCHRKTGDTKVASKFRPYSTAHMSGVPNVFFDKTKTAIGPKAAVSVVSLTVTCSTIVCHGQGTPVWGASNPTTHKCQKCHGSRVTAFATFSSPQVAPGYGSDGTDTTMTKNLPTDPRVGAHQRHLVSNAIANVIKCGECHVAVTNIRSGNHWNYSTATLTFNGRATANAHSPTVSRTGGVLQCSNTNCHTGKSNSGTTLAPFWNMTGLVKEGSLTVASCQKCHGFPPKNVGSGGTALSYDHTALGDPTSFPVATCTGCHSNMSNSGTTFANIFGDKTLHVNGIINSTGGCNGCHKYDIIGTNAWQNTTGTDLAHYKHIAFIKSRLSFTNLSVTGGGVAFAAGRAAAVCSTCHTSTLGQHNDGTKQVTFGNGGTAYTMGAGTTSSMGLVFGGANPSASGTTGVNITCSNLMCHYAVTPNWY